MHLHAPKSLRVRPLSSWILTALFLLGVGLRIGWALARPQSGASGEAFNVARALGEGRGFADAFQQGQGPTAHLLPVSPGLAGLVYRWFGVASPVSEFLLTAWSIFTVFAAFLLLFSAFRKLGTPLWARLGAVAYLCFAPTYIAQEAVDFRVWEGGLTSLLAAFFLDRLLAASAIVRTPLHVLGLLAVTAAVLFFVNPPFGVAAVLAGLLFAVRHLTFRQTLFTGAVNLVALACMIIPWAARNSVAVGEPVLLRSNIGLELALANHPAAVSAKDQGIVFFDRLNAIHPAISRAAFRRMQQAGGEVAYSHDLQKQAWAWITGHKGAALALMMRHFRQVFVPQDWQFTTFGTGRAAGLRAFLASIAGVLGLLGLTTAAVNRSAWMYPLILVAVPTLELSPFQPVPRYTYLFYPILAFAAADLIAGAVARLRNRRFRSFLTLRSLTQPPAIRDLRSHLASAVSLALCAHCPPEEESWQL